MINSVQIYRNMFVSLSVSGGTRSIRLREERKLRVLLYRELRKVIGPGRKEVRGD
jgi:hypothetical protein